jgi:hypothetical protein
MRSAKNNFKAISIILALAIFLPQLPHFFPEDVSRDGRVDLRDAILLVKDFKESSPTLESSLKDLNTLLTAFHVTSGLKQVLKTDEPEAVRTDDAPFVVKSELMPFQFHGMWSKLRHRSTGFESLNFKPIVPPPRLAV